MNITNLGSTAGTNSELSVIRELHSRNSSYLENGRERKFRTVNTIILTDIAAAIFRYVYKNRCHAVPSKNN